MSLNDKSLYRFGAFYFDVEENALRRNDKPVSLTPKMLGLLRVLIENRGRIVEKADFMKIVWADSFVEEGNLAVNIRQLRKMLDDDAHHPVYIETVPRRGYRFIAEVKEISAGQELKNGLAEIPSTKSKNFLIPIVAICVLLIVAIVIGSWYAFDKSVKSATPVLSAPFSSEKLTTNGKVFHAVVSPDGKSVVYTNVNGGQQSVWLRQLESENNVEIIPPSDDVYFGLALSPDANFLYFSRRQRNFDGQADIYRVSIFGGVPTKIVNEAQGWVSVSPDSGKISFVRCYYHKDENCSLWIADAPDGKNEKKLASRPPPFRIGDNKFAPDGKTVAFAAGQSENDANEFNLIEIDIESGAERELTAEKFFHIKNLAWLPDKSGLLLTTKKYDEKNFRIWQVSTVSGEASPLTKDSEDYATLSLDKNAGIIVSTQVEQDLRLLLFEPENSPAGRVLADAEIAAFAPNGKIIVSSRMTGNNEIWSLRQDGSERRQLTNNVATDNYPVASPDSSSIFFVSNRTGEMRVWRMNADGSNQTQVTQKEGGMPLFVSPDGKWLYYHHGRNRTLWRVSTTLSGEEQLILNKEKYIFALSPDGSQVAYSEKKGEEKYIMIVSLANGQAIKTFDLADGNAKIVGLVWSPDGKNLAYILSDSEYENNTLLLQPLDEKTPKQIAELGDEWVSSFALSPDGKIFAVAQGGWKHDAVLLRGLK